MYTCIFAYICVCACEHQSVRLTREDGSKGNARRVAVWVGAGVCVCVNVTGTGLSVFNATTCAFSARWGSAHKGGAARGASVCEDINTNKSSIHLSSYKNIYMYLSLSIYLSIAIYRSCRGGSGAGVQRVGAEREARAFRGSET